MKKYLSVVCLSAFFSMTLTACSSVSQDTSTASNHPSRAIAVTSIHDKKLNLPANAKFSFDPLQGEILPVDAPLQQAEVRQMITKLLKDELNTKGYVYNPSTIESSDFYIGYILFTEKLINDEQYNKIFKLNPGLKSQAENTKGTLMIYVLDSNRQFVWRSAMQGFIDESNSNEQRTQRAQQLIARIMTQFYND